MDLHFSKPDVDCDLQDDVVKIGRVTYPGASLPRCQVVETGKNGTLVHIQTDMENCEFLHPCLKEVVPKLRQIFGVSDQK